MGIRTDLAMEAKALWEKSAGKTTKLAGVRARERERDGFAVTDVHILDRRGEAALGKPAGRYVTLELPLLAVPTGGEEYHLSMEAALRRAKEQGAELVCFGDIDIENNRAWGEERCRNVGLEAVYPLWHHDRQENVREVLELGYRCLIKTLDRRVLPRQLLGRVMDRAMVEEMIACGDGYNDISMIQYAGLGVAMENAVLPVRKAADYVTLSNNDDGVAHVVEKFLL